MRRICGCGVGQQPLHGCFGAACHPSPHLTYTSSWMLDKPDFFVKNWLVVHVQ